MSRMKICSLCKVEKQISEFNRDSKKKDGFHSYCKLCAKEKTKDHQKRKPEKRKKVMKKYYSKNIEKRKIVSREYRKKNQEKEKNRVRSHREKNPELYRYYQSKRRSDKIKATPSWANLEEIKEIYERCPDGYHVDHIVPLRGNNVCGLHVENNLQYLKSEENFRKTNKWESG